MPQIFIHNTIEGADTTYPLEVDLATQTVGNIKNLISEKDGIQTTRQELTFDGIVMQSTSLLYMCGVQEGVTITLTEVEETITVVVQRASGEPFRFQCDRDGNISDLKAKIEEEKGIAVRKQRIKRFETTCYDLTRLYTLLYNDRKKVTVQLEELYNLQMHVYDGVHIYLTASSNELCDNLQSILFQRCRIPHHHQRTMYNGRELELGHRIGEYGVADGAVLQVERRVYTIPVFIKTLTGRTIVVDVASNDTVARVKEKISRQENIPVARQRIIFTGEQLPDTSCLLDYRIEHESAVHLILRTEDGFEITVQVPGGRNVVFEVTPSSTVEYIKYKARERMGLAPEILDLYFNDQLLDDDEALIRDVGIQASSVLRLVVDRDRSTQIFISLPNNDSITLWVNPDYTVQRLKEEIARKRDIPVELQALFYARQHLEDDRTLRSYTIEENHMLHLERVVPPLIHFSVKMANSEEPPLVFEQPANTTVDALKREIQARTRIAKITQLLFFGGLELDGSRKLGDIGITEGSTLDLILAKLDLTEESESGITLFVKTLTGKTITVKIEPTDSILDLKKKIEAKQGLPAGQQCIICGGKQLDDSLTLYNCGVQNQSVLHLVVRLPSQGPMSLTVEDGAESHQIDTTFGSTVASVKVELETATGVAVAEQTLLFEGEALEDAETLGSSGVTDGATLQLQH